MLQSQFPSVFTADRLSQRSAKITNRSSLGSLVPAKEDFAQAISPIYVDISIVGRLCNAAVPSDTMMPQ